jgi:hypothetical protein
MFSCLSRPTDRNGRRDLARTKEAIIDPLSLVQLREQPSKDAYAAKEIFGPGAQELHRRYDSSDHVMISWAKVQLKPDLFSTAQLDLNKKKDQIDCENLQSNLLRRCQYPVFDDIGA